MTRTITYVREDEKKHSVRFVPVDVGKDAVTGTIYINRASGLADAKRLQVTFEEVE